MKNGGLFTDEEGRFSKGKTGAMLIIVAAAILAIGKFMQGEIDLITLVEATLALGAGLGIFGIRDARKTEVTD